MSTLITTRNTPHADDIYARLIEAHNGLTPAESEALNARLILTLINHIGDAQIITQAIDLAKTAR